MKPHLIPVAKLCKQSHAPETREERKSRLYLRRVDQWRRKSEAHIALKGAVPKALRGKPIFQIGRTYPYAGRKRR